MEVKGRRGEEGRKVETSPPSVTAYAPEQIAVVRQDFNCYPADLWRKAIRRGRGAKMTLWPSPATQT